MNQRWFTEGDRVIARGRYALVIAAMFDAQGQDVKVLPEAGGEPFWIGHDQLTLVRAAEAR